MLKYSTLMLLFFPLHSPHTYTHTHTHVHALHACIHGGSNIKQAAAAAVLASVTVFVCGKGREPDLSVCLCVYVMDVRQ